MNQNSPNALIRETSPYLLQHAYNPVKWEAWNPETLKRAREEGKPLLISIGYAACHWCHVMEHECFEDPEVARVMNDHFIPVKVDREERPDVDHVYMDALQIMTGSGGWPLNVAALPDGRPFWGATYVPKKQWIQALQQLSRLYRDEPQRVREYASDLTTALGKINTPHPGASAVTAEQVGSWVDSWKPRFDPEYGGMRGAPKFMMPVTLELLMHWGEASGDETVRGHVRLSLRSMAYGGLYDPLGGGFARYSVDARWHVPHFEKMLYDNAQLMGLYARGYACYGDPLYRETVEGCLRFVQTELAADGGGYYASLDADSLSDGKLEEGAFYVWTEAELRQLLGPDFELFGEAYNINAHGRWEAGKYVLLRRESEAALADRLKLEVGSVRQRLQQCRQKLLGTRNDRPRPRLDNKIITSWNGLLLSGLADASRYCGLEEARQAALELGRWIDTRLKRPDGSLPHTFQQGRDRGDGFLEDYAALIEGYIKLYGISWDPSWMEKARELCLHVLDNFSEPGQALLYFDAPSDEPLIRRTLETADNVIPASNSIMARNLFQLGLFFAEMQWVERSRNMLAAVAESAARYSGQYSNWLGLALWLDRPFLEVAVCGSGAEALARQLGGEYLPHCLLAASAGESDLPLFRGRHRPQSPQIFICTLGQCHQPLEDPEIALTELREQLTLNI